MFFTPSLDPDGSDPQEESLGIVSLNSGTFTELLDTKKGQKWDSMSFTPMGVDRDGGYYIE